MLAAVLSRTLALGPPLSRAAYAPLQVHVRKLQLDADVQLPLVAGAARGFSGAELAALCNEAAIRAARRQSTLINMQDFTSVRAARNPTAHGHWPPARLV